jgi:YebC/PmpR family DNA-binding regulatory protein
MAGHNKWKQIKNKKESIDKKKNRIFSKILAAITLAAREEKNPQFNPRLRSLIEKARQASLPQENIDRVIHKTNDKPLQELIIEAYGSGGVALSIYCITDNSNRTVAELRKLLSDFGARMAEQGSVGWIFQGETPQFSQKLEEVDMEKFVKLYKALEEYPDTQEIKTNLNPEQLQEILEEE